VAFKTRKRLTFKQLKFINAYIGPAEFNAAEASRIAGYSEMAANNATRILDIPAVEAEIRRRCLKIAPTLVMSGDDIMRGIARIASDPRSPLKGGPTPVARLKAFRELGLIKGLYTNKIQLTGSLTLIDLLLGAAVLPPDNRPELAVPGVPQLPLASGAGPVTSTPSYDLPPEEEPMYG